MHAHLGDGGLGEDIDAEGDLVGLEVVAVLDARGEGGEVVGHLHVGEVALVDDVVQVKPVVPPLTTATSV